MAGANLLTLIDDIATILDDVAILTKIAAKKTAGVLGDDLALNAQQVSGVVTDRELPVVWAVAKGSAVNKLILVPVALGISVVAPWAVLPLLMIGGGYLCFEGFEKVVHKFFHKDESEAGERLMEVMAAEPQDMEKFESDKIKGAIRTDFILSAEIIVISLGTVAAAPFVTQLSVLTTIAALMTVGVYGLVAGIVKLDDFGLYLSQKESVVSAKVGIGIVKAAPYLMKGLGIAGTVAMFLVGGGIIAHGIPGLEGLILSWTGAAGAIGGAIETLVNGLVGVLTGAIVLGAVSLGSRVFKRAKSPHPDS